MCGGDYDPIDVGGQWGLKPQKPYTESATAYLVERDR